MDVAPASRSSAGDTRPASTSLLTRADLPWLAIVLGVAAAVRVAWVAYVNVDPLDGRFDDSVFYQRVGVFLAQGHGYIDPWGRGLTAHWPPAYPAALALVYKVFWVDLLWAKTLNLGFALITVALTYLIGRRLFERRVAFLGTLVLALFPGQVYFTTLVFSELMFAAAFMLVLLLTLVWTVERPQSRVWQVLLLGFLVGFAAMVRAEGLFLAPVLVGVWALTVRPWRRIAWYAVLLAFGTAVALTPWTVRNVAQMHQFIVIRSNGDGAISRALDPDAPELPFSPGPVRSSSEGLRYQLTHPVRALQYAGEKLGDFYGNDSEAIFLITFRRDPDPNPNYERPFSIDAGHRWQGLADRYYFGVAGAALAGAALAVWRRQRGAVVLVAPVIAWTMLFAFFNPVSRYHFPLAPIMAIFSGVFLVSVGDALRSFATNRPPAAVRRRHTAPAEALPSQSRRLSTGVDERPAR
jgi:4-amino-4-deoxy-L-arabinose transferase-like glycosyltransferase